MHTNFKIIERPRTQICCVKFFTPIIPSLQLLTVKYTCYLLYIQTSISLYQQITKQKSKQREISPLILAAAMRALLQFATAATSSQIPLPPASSAAVATTTTSNDDIRNNFTADIIVVLAALLCAVICMAGLALINRCNNTLRDSASNGTASTSLQQQQQQDTGIQLPLPPPPKRGLKKSALKALPKTRYDKATDIEKQTACVICLTEFEEGEEIRKLPQCGHEFHVGCVDKWLRAQSSCPSCRRVLVVVPPPKQGFERGGPRNKAAIGDSTSTFLP